MSSRSPNCVALRTFALAKGVGVAFDEFMRPILLLAVIASITTAQTMLWQDNFVGSTLDSRYVVTNGSASVSGGVVTLASACMQIPNQQAGNRIFSRTGDLQLEFRFSIENGAAGDMNTYSLFDSISQCHGSGPANGYVSGTYPVGSDNSEDGLFVNSGSSGTRIARANTVVAANRTHIFRQVLFEDGIIEIYIDNQLRLRASNGSRNSGGLTIRSWGNVRISQLAVSQRRATVVAPPPPTMSGAQMLSPVPGSTLASTNIAFSWSQGSGIVEYWLELGSCPTCTNYFDRSLGTLRTVSVSGLPSNGSTVYASLWSKFTNGEWVVGRYSYRAFTAAVSSARRTIFVVHGIRQSNRDVENLASNLRVGLNEPNTVIDAGFDFSDCADNRECSTDCSIEDGARRLALYVRDLASRRGDLGKISFVGYSMGGLIIRSLLVSNYYDVLTNRDVDSLITLGTPNFGYPWSANDANDVFPIGTCPVLVSEMASFYRLLNVTWESLPTQSPYLFQLNGKWAYTNFPHRPKAWLAVAGTFCSRTSRLLDGTTSDVCLPGDSSDGVVCASSATAQFLREAGRDRTISVATAEEFAHSTPSVFPLPMCSLESYGQPSLSDPPQNSDLFRTMLLFLRSR